MRVTKDSTDVSVLLYIADDSDGTPEIGVAYNTSGIDLKYRRDGAAATSITEATLASLTTAHTDGGFLEIGNGWYRLDVPDAAFATGVDKVLIYGTVTGMIVYGVTVELEETPATASALATVDTNVDAILVDTGTTLAAQISGLNNLSATQVNAECDTAISDASLATASALATVDSNVDAILVDTGTTIPNQVSALNDISVADILTTQMTESYASDGTAPTLAQALFNLQQTLGDFSITGTTITVKKLDGSTTAMTYTLDDATTPTSRTRAT